MVVEDDDLIGQLLQVSLRRLGYEVLAVLTTGEEALARAGVLRPDLVLMDISLAGKLDGIETARALRAQSQAPIIFLTAYEEDELIERAKDVAPAAYLLKPARNRQLHAAIEMALHQHRLEQRLRESEARYRALMQGAGDAILIADPQGNIVDANQQAEALLGYSRDELLQMSVPQIHPPEELERTLTAFREADRTGSGPVSNGRVLRKDGTTVPVDIIGSVVELDGRRWLQGIFHDITERKRAEAELLSHEQYLARLNDLTRAALEAADSKTMIQMLADRLGGLLNADDCYITRWDEEHQTTIPSAASGHLRDTYPARQSPPGEVTMTESVLRAGQALAAEDVFNSPHLSPRIAARYPARSLLGLPLIAGGRKLGAVLVSFNQPHHFTPEEIVRGEQAAGQIALALAKTELLEAERQRAAQLTRANAVITALARVAARVDAAPDIDGVLNTLGQELKAFSVNCLIALCVPGQEALNLRYVSFVSGMLESALSLARPFLRIETFQFTPRNFPFYQEVIEQRRAVLVRKPLEATRAILPGAPDALIRQLMRLAGVTPAMQGVCLPLVIEERALGLMWLWGPTLQESEIPAASLFASQVAVALERARLYAEVQQLAITDALTGLYNRRGLFELGQREIDRAARFNRPLTALMIDLDHFKRVNDTYGHAVGDQVLRAVAECCRNNIREIDVAGRYGGEEVVILLPENDRVAASQVAERLRQAISATPAATERGDIAITISVGVAALAAGDHDLAALIHRADVALYAAKQGGRNRVVVGE